MRERGDGVGVRSLCEERERERERERGDGVDVRSVGGVRRKLVLI